MSGRRSSGSGGRPRRSKGGSRPTADRRPKRAGRAKPAAARSADTGDPTRRILSTISRRGSRGVTLDELRRRLGSNRARKGKGASDSFRKILQALRGEGRIELVDGRYRLRRPDGLVEGVFRTGRGDKGGGRVREEGGREWRVVAPNGAVGGDRVLIQLLEPRRAGRAEVLHVLEGARADWVGLFEEHASGGRVVPYGGRVEWRVLVSRGDVGDACEGDVVHVRPASKKQRASRESRGRASGAAAPRGRVTAVLGRPGEAEADYRAAVWQHRLREGFPDEVMAEVDALREVRGARAGDGRVDLRGEPFLTIDPATAKDHDDAVWIEARAEGGAVLHVAIADVSHYVAPGSAIDREALLRSNTVYFPDRAIPMLPERLSSDLCSLRPDQDRPVMIVSMTLDRSSKVTRKQFRRGWIRSQARLAYEDAAKVMESGGATKKVSDAGVVEQLTTLARITRKLTERRLAAGAIDFDFPGLEVRLDRDGRAVAIDEAERTIAHRGIEESMLAANRAVAEKLSEAGAVALHRNHEAPLPTDMVQLRELLSSFGLLDGRVGDGPLAPKELADALARVAGRPEDRLVQLAALRSLRQARYGANGVGHYALAFAHYTHFTSPIRRYADLVVHRALIPLLARGCRGESGELPELDRSEAARIGGRVSWRERQTADVERETLDRKRCALMIGRAGEQLSGTVSSVAEHGVYVRLDVLPVEGLIHRSQLPRAYELDDRRHALSNAKTGERIALGDRLEVEVTTVDLSKLRIDFGWVGRLKEPRES